MVLYLLKAEYLYLILLLLVVVQEAQVLEL
jgi:hypothetical protein